MAEVSTVLILGFSRIAQRRVLPALERLDAVTAIEIASRRGEPEDPPGGKVSRFHDDFEAALDVSSAGLVYVSTVNSEHAEWAERALASGRHVIVDKPSFLSVEDGARLVSLAGVRERCLAEAVVWAAHPQVAKIRQVFAEAGSAPSRVSALFSMPPLDPDNFRYRASLGGGALWDLGPYAVSLGREVFAAEPVGLACKVGSRGGPDGVDTAFSLLAEYPGGRALVGHFGFDTEYRNEVTVLGPEASVSLSRVFTTPPGLPNELAVQAGNAARSVRVAAADSFGCFFQEVIESVGSGSFSGYAQTLSSDLGVLTRLRAAAGEA